jgi:uncharacterized protein (DUF427 family)
MALDLARQRMAQLAELRTHPTAKRVRVRLGEVLVADTTDAVLVWEPRRVVPDYAVPRSDVRLPLLPADPEPTPATLPPILPPGHFSWHTTPGTVLTLDAGDRRLGPVAFAFDDPDLGDRIALDFAAFDWFEEDEQVISHPHDPMSRIDALASDRHVVVRLGDAVLADSTRPVALYETGLPTRWYLPREDVRMDLLVPVDKHTTCAYKGVASYFGVAADPAAGDVAWYYPEPLHDAVPVGDMVSFWPNRTELTVGGVRDRRGMPGED